MVAVDIAQFHLLDGGVNLSITHRQAVRRVMEQAISPRLGFKADGEC